MNTTNLFVELIVIGVGAAAWMCLIVLTAFGWDRSVLEKLFNEPAIAVPALAVIYLLGILTDRLADGLFHSVRMKAKQQRYKSEGSDYFQDRALVLVSSEQLAQQYEYNRSRQRICRGWAFNSLATLICSNVFLFFWRDNVPTPGRIAIVGSLLLIAITLGCCLSWESLSNTELKRMRETANVLREQKAKSAAGAQTES